MNGAPVSVATNKDYYVVGFPKSGNTWVARILADLLDGDIMGDDPVNAVYNRPDLHRAARIHKLHNARNCQSPDLRRADKVIYVVRDVRDVLVSSFFFNLRPKAAESAYAGGSCVLRIRFLLETTIAAFGWGGSIKYRIRSFSFRRLIMKPHVGRWSRHAKNWIQDPRTILVQYERLLVDPVKEINRVMRALDEPI